MADGSEIRDAAQAVAAIAEAVPVYQDAIQPAARQLGQALETVAKTVNIALAPVSALVWGYEEIRHFVSTRVAEKLATVPPERIQPPLPQVAGPALEALRYTGHDKDFRELYANLLATSLDELTAMDAHPSFVEIIRAMSPDEARIVRLLSDGDARPVVEVRASELVRYEVRLENFSTIPEEAGCQFRALGPVYLSNLCRLGLVAIPDNEASLSENEAYAPLELHPDLGPLKDEIEASDRYVSFYRTFARLTPLGVQFCRACVFDHREIVSAQAAAEAPKVPRFPATPG